MSRASGLPVSSVRRIVRAFEFRRFLDEIEKVVPDDLDVHLGDGQPRRPRDAADPQPAGQAAALASPPDADGLVLDQPSRALPRVVDGAPDSDAASIVPSPRCKPRSKTISTTTTPIPSRSDGPNPPIRSSKPSSASASETLKPSIGRTSGPGHQAASRPLPRRANLTPAPPPARACATTRWP